MGNVLKSHINWLGLLSRNRGDGTVGSVVQDLNGNPGSLVAATSKGCSCNIIGEGGIDVIASGGKKLKVRKYLMVGFWFLSDVHLARWRNLRMAKSLLKVYLSSV